MIKLPTTLLATALMVAALGAQLALPASSSARVKHCGSVRMQTDPSYRMHVKILRGNVTCRTAKRIIAGSVQPGPLAGFMCDDYPGERPGRITCKGKSSVDGRHGKFRAVR